MERQARRAAPAGAKLEEASPEQLLLSVITAEASRHPELVNSLMQGYTHAHAEAPVEPVAAAPRADPAPALARPPGRDRTPLPREGAVPGFSPLSWRLSLILRPCAVGGGIWLVPTIFSLFPLAGQWTTAPTATRALLVLVQVGLALVLLMLAARYVNRREFVPELENAALAGTALFTPVLALCSAVVLRDQRALGVFMGLVVVAVTSAVLRRLTRRVRDLPAHMTSSHGLGCLTLCLSTWLPIPLLMGGLGGLAGLAAWRHRRAADAAAPSPGWRFYQLAASIVLWVTLAAMLSSRLFLKVSG